MLVRSPISIDSWSARATAPYQMLAAAPIVTAPDDDGRRRHERLVVDLRGTEGQFCDVVVGHAVLLRSARSPLSLAVRR